MPKIKFNVVKRVHEECVHDTGIHHDRRMPCLEAERVCRAFALDEKDPDHQAIWHSTRNPDLIQIGPEDLADIEDLLHD